VDTDVRVGKRTLAVRHGRRFAHVEYAVMMTLALAAPVVLVTGLGFGWPVLLPLATAPLAVVLTRRLFAARDGASHNILLGQTAGLLLVHGVLLSAGLVLGAP
jgi:1,4-dihydroxy-2-naphthoate octaprenyltransferase